MTARTLLSIALNLLAIVLCGAAGAVAGFFVIQSFHLTGVLAALLATVVAMVVASVAWALGATMLRGLRLLR